MATKHEVLLEHLNEWLAAKGDKKQRSRITQVVCQAILIHPKSISRAFRRLQMKDPSKKERRGRAVYFTPDVLAALKDLWEAGGRVCGELLHPQIPEYVAVLQRDKMWAHTDEATYKLLQMSERTVKRKTTIT